MKQFLAVFMGSTSDAAIKKWEAMNEATRTERETAGKTAWMNWVMQNHKSIVSHGAPLGKTKKVNPDGISDIKNLMAAYTVVQADSHEAAAKIFLNHPHFMIFPGDSVEIMECLPMPT